jgi:hypothetical protein
MKLILFLFFAFTTCCVFAQQNTLSSGGDVSNTSGSIAVSIGQIDYVNTSSANFGICQGVQQPFAFCNLLISLSNSNPTNCGNNNGSASVSVSGGIAPYTIQWSNGDFGSTADSLSPGLYVVQVTDASACYASLSVQINPTNGPQISLVNQTNITCPNGSNGSVSISLSGGVSPYTVLWNTGATTNIISNLTASSYDVTVTDNNGCVAVSSFNVTAPLPITYAASSQAADCNTANGSATIDTISGGTAGYTILWEAAANNQTSLTATGLLGGYYDFTLTDAAGCSQAGSVVVPTLGSSLSVVLDTIISTACSNNDVAVTTAGGSLPYNFSWSNGAITEDLTGVTSGTYFLTVTDANGCTQTQSVLVPENDLDSVNICVVTVDSLLNVNKLIWVKPSGATNISYYKIYRETNAFNVFLLVDTVHFSSPSEFVDVVADPAVRSWRYKISAVSTCGQESDLSIPHKTIHLMTNLGLSNNVNLSWDNYNGFSYPSFVIDRFHNSTGWQTIATLPSNLNSYTDNFAPNGNVIYSVWIDAPFCDPSRVGVNTSRSNIKNQGLMNGIEELGKELVRLYPNPAHETIRILGLTGNINRMEVFDIFGKQVSLYHSHEGILDVSKYENGTYLLHIISTNNEYWKKFVVVR